jgi:periplasmic protein TonB
MLKLIGSQAIRTTHAGVAALSMVTHAGLIAVAAVSSGHPSYGTTTRAPAALERITYSIPARLVEHTAIPSGTERRSSGPARGRRFSVPDMSKLRPVELPRDLGVPVPDVDGLSLNAGDVDWRQEGFGDGGTAALIPHALLPLGGVYSEALVERTVWPRRGNPAPNYPESLRSAGIDGSFFVVFVVDTTGRVEKNSIVFPPNANELFTQAVRRSLLRSRYFPAEVAGRPVRQEVRQEFVFRLVPSR